MIILDLNNNLPSIKVDLIQYIRARTVVGPRAKNEERGTRASGRIASRGSQASSCSRPGLRFCFFLYPNKTTSFCLGIFFCFSRKKKKMGKQPLGSQRLLGPANSSRCPSPTASLGHANLFIFLFSSCYCLGHVNHFKMLLFGPCNFMLLFF